MDEQVILFARATHIAGVEGAALANLLFALNAKQVVIVGNPVTASEKFFPSIAKNAKFALHRIYGDVDPAQAGDRHADFTLPLDKLNALEPALAI
jgi:capsular polysaccharide biosynthesis protein